MKLFALAGLRIVRADRFLDAVGTESGFEHVGLRERICEHFRLGFKREALALGDDESFDFEQQRVHVLIRVLFAFC